jgi:hypothetical protein
MTYESIEALRRANPRRRTDFAAAVDTAAETIQARIVVDEPAVRRPRTIEPQPRRSRPRVLRLSAAAFALAAAAAATVFLTVGSVGGGHGVESAAAAIREAATVTAVSAEQSGTAVVRMTHDGQLWVLKTVRWNGENLEITDGSPGGPSSGHPLIVVNGVMYGHDPCCEGWVEIGNVTSIDPGSGTTPTEQLAAVREDIGGTTLRRLAGAMTGLTTRRPGDGTTVYRGRVPAGQIARETGFKEGQSIRVLPFGYVAHDEAADPGNLLDTAVTVGADGVVRQIAVTWGTWTYTVTYSALGSTPAILAPANARPLVRAIRP